MTNILNLPEPLVRAATRDRYTKGDARYSVTELIKPARMGALERLYGEAIVEDVADNIWSVLGRIGHGVLEASGAPETGAILEDRLYAEVAGVRISGAMDHTLLLPTGCVDDYKYTSVWAILEGVKPEWEAQLNIYGWLRALAGQVVTELRIIAILRDWSIAKARTSGEGRYPKRQVVAMPVPLWAFEKTQVFVEARIHEHVAADIWANAKGTDYASCPDEPKCSDAERWVRPRKFALMKEGRKTAVKLYDTRQEAEYAAQAAKGLSVATRGGEPIKCLDYCSVGRAGFCSQWEADKIRLATENNNSVDTSAFDE